MIFIYNGQEYDFEGLIKIEESPFTRYNEELNYIICRDPKGEVNCRFRMNGLTPELILDTLNDLLNTYGTDIVLQLKED